MTSPKLPDLGAAILVYLKNDNMHADGLVGATTESGKTRIYLQWPDERQDNIVVPPFKNCIIISVGRGGLGDIGLSLQGERVDIHCYGIDRRLAHQLWRRLDYYLVPPNRSRKVSFVAANTRIYMIQREGGPIRLIDADKSNWPYTVASYIFTYSGVGVV